MLQKTSLPLCCVLLGAALLACGPAGSTDPDGGILPIPDAGILPAPDAGTEPDAGTLPEDAGTDAGVEEPVVSTPGDPLLFRTHRMVTLVDTANPANSSCGTHARIEGMNRRIVVDLDDCTVGEIPEVAVGVSGSITLTSDTNETVEVRIGEATYVVGALQTSTHGFTTLVDGDRTFAVDVSGSEGAELLIQVTAALVPQSEGGEYVHLLNQPYRWFASNPNDDGFRDVWPRLDSVLSYEVYGFDQGSTGMLGTVHLGPGVWRDERVTFHMGAADEERGLPRWSSVPVDGHFPWRYSSFYTVGANPFAEVELRASAEQFPFDTGIEPWVDVVGFLAPQPGLVYRPLDKPKQFAPATHVNDGAKTYATGFTDIAGVVGTLTFELPHFPFPDQNRWFFVHVADSESRMPGALGGGLEGPDWMTAGLNQNGTVTVRFMSKVSANGAFVMRHHAYLAGGPSPGAQYFDVTVKVRIEGVLTTGAP